MLNDILIGDEKDRQIASLKVTIKKFKEYDNERKKYYCEKMQRLGELESYVQELEEEGTGLTIARLKKEVKTLNQFVKMRQMENRYPESEVDEKVSIYDLKAEVKALRQKVKVQRESIDILSKRLESVNK